MITTQEDLKITISKKEYDDAAVKVGVKLMEDYDETMLTIVLAGMIYAKELQKILFKEADENGSK